MLFQATLHFGGKDVQGETSSRIIFEAENMEAAKADAGRWFANRHSALPDYFGKLFCVKIYAFNPQRVREDGYLPPNTGLFGYEWKCDWGKPYGT